MSSPDEPRSPGQAPRALAIADATWFTTENLFREVQRPEVSTLLLKCMDYRVAWARGGRPWNWGRRLTRVRPDLWERELVLPSGWMKRFPRVGMRPIARAVRSWRREPEAGGPLTLVMTYPYYLFLRDQLRPDRTVYYNFDDYTLFWPAQAVEIRAMEIQAVRESTLTACASRLRTDFLKTLVPEAADRIIHMPHGTPRAFLDETPWTRPAPPPDDLAAIPRPLLGYVGSFEDRTDWRLLDALAVALPSASIVLIGRPANPIHSGEPWFADYQRCVARPNVHLLGWRPQTDVPRYYRAFDVCLIPYQVDHPFNRACSPTKIMDAMGTGRPIVSTALPECLLYTHLLDVAADAPSFIEAVRVLLANQGDDGKCQARLDHARTHTCERVVGRLLDRLEARAILEG